MKAKADKCHVVVSSDERCTTKIEDFNIEYITEEKIFGVKFYFSLYFESHVTCLCKNANQNINAFSRVSHYS